MRSLSLASVLLAGRAIAAQTPVSSALLQNLVRYTAFSSAAYADECAEPPYGATAVKYISDHISGSQATIFRDDAAQEFVLAFRGTSSVRDFIADFDQTLVTCDAPGVECAAAATNCTCSNGYLVAYKAIADEVDTSLKANMDANSGYKLVVTGHSLGGGLAAISSLSLKGLGYDFETYSYGQPRTGDQAFADAVDSNFGGQGGTYHRVTHTNDGVPQIPSADDGFRHSLTEYWQSQDDANTQNTVECTGQEPPDCNQSEPGYGIGNGGIGINLAHLSYFDISIGNPLNTDATCDGSVV